MNNFKSEKELFRYKYENDPIFVKNIIDHFHRFYYYNSFQTWKNTYWLGIPIQKNPMDLIIYQELIHRIKPDFIIETGTKLGGSALFFASMCDLINYGKVISIDIDATMQNKYPKHHRITYFKGNSVDIKIIDLLKDKIEFFKEKMDNLRILVILDSDHNSNHVYKELCEYSQFVSIGSYIIVEDMNIGGYPVLPELSDNCPKLAIDAFLEQNLNFIIDKDCEKFYFTFNPEGFLKRIK